MLLRHALSLIGIPHSGPGEKVAWWVTFTYKGYPCELARQKFGLRLRIGGDLTEEQAGDLLTKMRKKLVSAVRAAEGLLAGTASDTLNAGNVTVVNQHRQLRRAYDYFRDRATGEITRLAGLRSIIRRSTVRLWLLPGEASTAHVQDPVWRSGRSTSPSALIGTRHVRSLPAAQAQPPRHRAALIVF